MMDLSNFKLLKEDADNYEIQHPNGKSLRVDKKGMSEKAHKLIKKLNPVHNYADAGVVTPAQPSIPVTSEPQAAPPSQSQMPDIPIEKQTAISDRAFRAEAASEKAKGQAESEGGQKTAAIIDQAMQNLSQMKTQNDIVDQYRQKDQALLDQYANQKIDPDRYWKNQNTGAKIASGISLILGGMGAGLTHGRNMAQDLIEGAIARDIEAQKNDQSKSANLYQMNRAALGDEASANIATQNQMLTALEYKLKQQAALTGSSVAKANADMAIAQINQRREINNQQLAFIRQGLGAPVNGQQGAVAQDPSMLVPALVRDPSQQKQIIDEIERAKIIKNQYNSIMDAFDKAAVDQRPLSGGSLKNAIPGVNSPYIGALHAEMGPTFQHLEGTVRQAAMDNMDKNITPQFGDSDEKIAVKRQALQNYLLNGMAGTAAKAHGIDLNKFSATSLPRPQISEDQQARDWAKAHPNDPRSAKILEKSGLK